MDKVIKIELGVIIVLIVLIMLIPNRKLESFQESSKVYQHTSNVEALNLLPNPNQTVDNTTIIYPNRGLGGYSAYKDGTYNWPSDEQLLAPDSSDDSDNSGATEDSNADSETSADNTDSEASADNSDSDASTSDDLDDSGDI